MNHWHSPASTSLRAALLATVAGASLACASAPRRFPLRDPVWQDGDTAPVSVACRPDPDPPADDPAHRLCLPELYESPLAWDVADKTVFRPLSRALAVDVGGEAVNVNSVDEVPDSSWFSNRLGKNTLSADEVERGGCDGAVLDPAAPDSSWVIDQGKTNGSTPGFRVRVAGKGKFVLKGDDLSQPERASAAQTIGARFYHAFGFWAPCDSVVYFRKELLTLKPGLTSTDNTGVTVPFDQKALDDVLGKTARRGDLYRMVASRWLPGRAIGPFKYEETRDDDPNDVVPHEDRRELRGGRLLAAWLNHFDAREQNSMAVWLSVNPRDPESSPGHVRHFYLDTSDCFGSPWAFDEVTRRLGHSYYLDFADVLQDTVTLGLPERPWDRTGVTKGAELFGYFHARDFDAEKWKPGYPNPAFSRMTERDGAWAARIVAAFGKEHVEAAIRAGDLGDPAHRSFLFEQLWARRRALLSRYLSRLSPLANVQVQSGNRLCSVDLAKKNDVFDASRIRYSANMYTGRDLAARAPAPVVAAADGSVCVTLAHSRPDAGEADDSPERYAIVDVSNGASKGPLRAHLYDLGPRRGFRLVGVERPEGDAPPR